MDIGYTGATGRLGRRIGEELLRRGRAHRAMARSPSAIPPGPGREARRAEYDDEAGLVRAFTGLRRVALMSTPDAPEIRRRRHRHAIRAARAAGVEHVVFLSLRDARPDSPFPFAVANHDAECVLIDEAPAGAPDWTILRPNLYAESIATMGGQDIADGHLVFPWAHAAVGYVARADIAAVVGGLLEHGGHLGEALDVTGRRALTLAEVAPIVARVVGHPVRVDPMTLPDYAARLANAFPPDTATAFAGLSLALAEGRFDVATDVVERIGGRPAEPLEATLHRALRGPSDG